MQATENEYAVRPYRRADRDGTLALLETVWGETEAEWFDWRYGGPYLDYKAITVAERDGDVVGALPCMAFPLRAGDRSALALQPAGITVHPDHRRRGLFSRLAEELIAHYTPKEPSFLFNFPTEAARKGCLKHGWRPVPVPSYFRVQNPAAELDGVGDGRGGRVVGRSLASLSRGYFAARKLAARKRARRSERDITVTRHSDVPAAELASLYEENVPEKIHVRRDEEFYDWRYGAPGGSYTAYVAHRDDPVAAVITHDAIPSDYVAEGTTIAPLLDSAPLDGDRTAAFDQIVEAVVADHRDCDILKATQSTLPRATAAAYGFLPDDSPPLSWMTSPGVMVTRPLASDPDAGWTFDGNRLAEPSNWRLALGEWDPSY